MKHFVRTRRTPISATMLVVALCSVSCRSSDSGSTVTSRVPPSLPEDGAIGALGRIQPGTGGTIRVGARGLSGQATILKQLLVHEGDTVRVGQQLGELDSRDELAALEQQAKAGVEVARRRLAQVVSGAKPSDVAAAQADLDALEAQHAHDLRELERYKSVGDNATASDIDRLTVAVEVSAKSLASARERLASLREVREVDVELARAQLDQAIRNEATARAGHLASIVRSPIDGRVVRINAWPGEDVGSDGVMEIAPNEPMYVVAEIAESDVGRVKVGQRAKISGAGLRAPLEGTVERIGLKVLENRLLPIDPANFTDGRVVNTWIRLASAKEAADRINLRVDVVIQP